MKINNTLQLCVDFAHFCRNEGFEPFDVAHLAQLIRNAAAAGARACNTGNSSDRERRAGVKVKLKAESMGLTTDWPGLYPTFKHRDGKRGEIYSWPGAAT